MGKVVRAAVFAAVALTFGFAATLIEAPQAAACTVYPGTSVYCWPGSGGTVPPPHR